MNLDVLQSQRHKDGTLKQVREAQRPWPGIGGQFRASSPMAYLEMDGTPGLTPPLPLSRGRVSPSFGINYEPMPRRKAGGRKSCDSPGRNKHVANKSKFPALWLICKESILRGKNMKWHPENDHQAQLNQGGQGGPPTWGQESARSCTFRQLEQPSYAKHTSWQGYRLGLSINRALLKCNVDLPHWRRKLPSHHLENPSGRIVHVACVQWTEKCLSLSLSENRSLCFNLLLG